MNSGKGFKAGWIRLLAAMLLTILAAGCQTDMMNRASGSVSPDKRIPLSEGTLKSGTYVSRHIMVKYKYAREGTSMNISGDLRYSDSIIYNFTNIDYFHLDAIFLDSQGNVLGTKGLTSSSSDRLGTLGGDGALTFYVDLTLPANTAAMAFSYKGQVHASESLSGSGGTYIWEYPVH